MQLAKYVMKKLVTVTMNMLFLRIAVQKITYISKKNIHVKLLF